MDKFNDRMKKIFSGASKIDYIIIPDKSIFVYYYFDFLDE